MDKIITNIIKKLENNGYNAYIVGGYVRDYLLGIDTNDIDICTNALPKDVISILELVSDTKDNYGCVNLKTKKYNIDITTFRKESNYSKGKPMSIIFVNDIKSDLSRRDFTINALLMDKDGNVIDYFNGLKDLKDKRIRCIGDINKKINEDPLRILRMVRLKAKYNFKIDDELKDFVKYNSKILLNISNYKIKEELDKMFSNQNKLEAIKILDELNISDILNLHTKNIKYTKDIMGIYAQLNNLNLPFTKLEKDTIIKIQEILKQNKIDNNILYKYGLYICTIAGEILGINTKDINKMFNKLPIKSKKDIKINIKTLVKLNNNCYNNINEIYSLLEYNIINGIIKNNNREIVKFIRKKV